jgi:hypothetical protein
MKYLIALLFTSSLWGQTLTCPQESFLIEYISPITNGKISLCGYIKDGATVKHGEEWNYNTKGELIKKLNFNHGEEVKALGNLPGVEEKKDLSKETAAMESIGQMLQILTLKKANPGKGMFKIQRCDPKPVDWVRGAVMLTPINKTYSFGEKCDVAGAFTANFTNEFPVKFNLRNLQDYTTTDMTVKMAIKKSASGITYGFEVLTGAISSVTSSANFTVHYEVEINPMTGAALAGSQKGTVTLTKLDGKDVKASSPILFEE